MNKAYHLLLVVPIFACGDKDTGTPAVSTSFEFTQLSSGDEHNYCCRCDWNDSVLGSRHWGQSTPPSGDFVAAAAGGEYSCGLDTEGLLYAGGRALPVRLHRQEDCLFSCLRAVLIPAG